MDDALLKWLETAMPATEAPPMPAETDVGMQRTTRLVMRYPPEHDGRPKILVVPPHRSPWWEWLHPPVVTIGRLRGSGIVLDDPEVSRLHCRMSFDGEFWHIIDENSRNGIHLCGKRIQRRLLRTGDLCRVGAVHLLFSDGGSTHMSEK